MFQHDFKQIWYDFRAKTANIWGISAPNMTPVTPVEYSQKSKTNENGLEGPILTHKVDTKCFDMNLSRSGTILEAKVRIWG